MGAGDTGDGVGTDAVGGATISVDGAEVDTVGTGFGLRCMGQAGFGVITMRAAGATTAGAGAGATARGAVTGNRGFATGAATFGVGTGGLRAGAGRLEARLTRGFANDFAFGAVGRARRGRRAVDVVRLTVRFGFGDTELASGAGRRLVRVVDCLRRRGESSGARFTVSAAARSAFFTARADLRAAFKAFFAAFKTRRAALTRNFVARTLRRAAMRDELTDVEMGTAFCAGARSEGPRSFFMGYRGRP